MVLLVGLIFSGGAFVTNALRDHRSWQDMIDTACLAGYALMIEAGKKTPTQARLDAEAKAEEDWITLLNHESVPVPVILDVNGYTHTKPGVLRVRRSIAKLGRITPRLRARLTQAQEAAQNLVQYGILGGELSVCGREAVDLE
jgi:hypothetical protein